MHPRFGRAFALLSVRSGTVMDMENTAEALMLSGTLGWCPDCADHRILMAVADAEFCCTDCDGAVFVIDEVGAAALVTRVAS